MRIHPGTQIGYVHYTVKDLETQVAFYRDILGFKVLSNENGTASLGAGSRELLRFTEVPSATRPGRTTGLYHTAFLVPTRWDLAHLVRQVIVTRTKVQGHSNHGTHLALYLPDPEGNGIELAWDFPEAEWPMRDGKMLLEEMPREGIDIEALLAEIEKDPTPWPGLDPQTRVGHVHLHVSRLDETKAFYHHLLGFDVTLESDEMGALFMSAGGYHHHIGSNVWRGIGAPPPPPNSVGLRYFSVELPDSAELERLVNRAQAEGRQVEQTPEGILIRDPSQNGVLLTVSREA